MCILLCMERMTTAEVAARVGRDISTISRWVTAGRLTPIARVGGGAAGGAMVFDPAAVEALAAELDRGRSPT